MADSTLKEDRSCCIDGSVLRRMNRLPFQRGFERVEVGKAARCPEMARQPLWVTGQVMRAQCSRGEPKARRSSDDRDRVLLEDTHDLGCRRCHEHRQTRISCKASSKWMWAVATLFFLHALFAVAGEQAYWASAVPGQVQVGQSVVVSISGAHFLVGAQDYRCRFETAIVNVTRGEFEVRQSPLTVLAHDSAKCTTPDWDLPATDTILKVVKSEDIVRKDGPMKTFRFIHAVLGTEPSTGPSHGSEIVTIYGQGFGMLPGSQYRSKFTGRGGVSTTSEPCILGGRRSENLHAILCKTPKWPYPASLTTVTLWNNAELIVGDVTFNYTFLPSCTSLSQNSSYASSNQNIAISAQGFQEGELVRCTFKYNGITQNDSNAQVLTDPRLSHIIFSLLCLSIELLGVRWCFPRRETSVSNLPDALIFLLCAPYRKVLFDTKV
jgi:hypothetical protein